MIFRTEIPIKKELNQIGYDSKIMLFGSCFTKNIGDKLEYFKFQSNTNPFGILFHPLAIEHLIANSINKKEYTEQDVFFLNERWHTYDAHSDLSDVSKEKLLSNLNSTIEFTHKSMQQATHVIITLGTAWVYRLIEKDRIVANCHKVPQKKFLKELLTPVEISESLAAIVSLIRECNKRVEIIFTVSPVRHLKDGFTENSLSKANLISGIHQIVEPRNRIHYFPSYEIMTDDLRDYRFYKKDMLHPNETAIDYIWENFKKAWIDEKEFQLMQEIDSIQNGLAHRPFHPNSNKHRQFLLKLKKKIVAVNQKLPHLNFESSFSAYGGFGGREDLA
jgi:hypothetical protein